MASLLQAPAWPAALGDSPADKAPLPLPGGPVGDAGSGRPQSLTPSGQATRRALLAVCDAVVAAAPELDTLDSRFEAALF